MPYKNALLRAFLLLSDDLFAVVIAAVVASPVTLLQLVAMGALDHSRSFNLPISGSGMLSCL